MVGGALGPLLGGVMLEYFWWGSVFLLNVPVMALLLVLGPMLLPENRDPDAGRLDLASAGLSLVAMLLVIYGIKLVAQDGMAVVPAISMVAGLGLAALFVVRQRSLNDPLIDLQLFKVPAFSVSVCTQLVTLTAMAGIYFFVAQYMQLVLGMSPLLAGLWMLPWTAAGMIASMLTPAMARRIRPAHLMGAGLILAAIGMAMLTTVGGGAGLAVIVTSFIIISTGLHPALTLTTDMIMGVAPPDRAGAASAISETSSELGLALGMAILGSVGVASYRRIMAENVLRGIAPEAAEKARATLGGAVGVAERLGGQPGTELAATARNAFAQSFELVATISAIVVMMMAIAAVVLLRRVPPGSQSTEEADLPAAA